MTPEKRLNQIEPVVADVAQKVDRLIEGNGQIISEVSKISGIEKEVINIKKEVADIKKETAKIPSIERATAKIPSIERETAKIPGIERTVAITAKGLAELTIYVTKRFDLQEQQTSELRQEMNLKFEQIITLLHNKLP